MFYGRKDQYYLTWPVRAGNPACFFRTGQSRCHDQHGRETDCAGSFQDGAIRFGTAWPTPRFSVHEETVRDELTGLYWLPRADLTGSPVTWGQALEAVERLREQRFGGQDDWRLPNINELESLVDCSTHDPALPGDHPFTHAGEGYWSSTTSFFETDWAWVLYLRKGALGVGFKTNPDFLVWPVAGAPEMPEQCAENPGNEWLRKYGPTGNVLSLTIGEGRPRIETASFSNFLLVANPFSCDNAEFLRAPLGTAETT